MNVIVAHDGIIMEHYGTVERSRKMPVDTGEDIVIPAYRKDDRPESRRVIAEACLALMKDHRYKISVQLADLFFVKSQEIDELKEANQKKNA